MHNSFVADSGFIGLHVSRHLVQAVSVGSRVPLEEGIGRMASWTGGACVRKSQQFEDVELDRGLSAVWKDD